MCRGGVAGEINKTRFSSRTRTWTQERRLGSWSNRISFINFGKQPGSASAFVSFDFLFSGSASQGTLKSDTLRNMIYSPAQHHNRESILQLNQLLSEQTNRKLPKQRHRQWTAPTKGQGLQLRPRLQLR